MQLDPGVGAALNAQINLEFASAYAYLGMAAYFAHEGWGGFSSWMALQGQEELGHARKFIDYLLDRGGRVTFEAIAAAPVDFAAPLAAFEGGLAHEQRVSHSICALYEKAAAAKDYPTTSFLKWFLDEQVEEEKSAHEMIARLRLVGDSKGGLFQLDREAARRAEQP